MALTPDPGPGGAAENAPPAEALRRSEEMFRLLVERVQDYAIFLLDPDGLVASWNAGAVRINGYTADEIVGRPYATFFTEEDRAAGRPERLMRQARVNGRVEDEGWRMRKDGSLFWADAVLTGLTDGEGPLRGYAKVTRDLTERRRAEESLERALADTERRRDDGERARESLQNFLAVMAHEIRNPLASIKANAQMLRRRGNAIPDDRLAGSLKDIEEQTSRMNEMLGFVLDAASIGAGRLNVLRERTDLVSPARRAMETAQATTEQHRIVLDAPERLEGEWDPERLGQVIYNLLANAIKYSPEGGEIRLRIRQDDGQALLSVTDHGMGILHDDLPRLFQLFSRLAPGSGIGGTGLGLYIVRGIIEAHGGRVQAESDGRGQGTAFTVTLPLTAGQDTVAE